MILFLSLTLLATIALVLRILLHEARGEQSWVPTWALVGIAATLGSTGIVYGLLEQNSARGPEGELARRRDGSEGLLSPGSAAPAFEAEGWLNGRPPTPGDGSASVIVVDLWALW